MVLKFNRILMSAMVLTPLLSMSCKKGITSTSETSSDIIEASCNPNKPSAFGNCRVATGLVKAFIPGVTKGTKIPGSYKGVQAELEDGNLKNANLSCLNSAMTSGTKFPTATTGDVYNFSGSFGKSKIIMPVAVPTRINSFLQSSSPKTPLAFRVNECTEDPQRTACMQLFEKSVSEAPQAYFNSKLNDDPKLWREITDYLGLTKPDLNPKPVPNPSDDQLKGKDISVVLAEESAKLDPEKDKKQLDILNQAISEDSILVATKLIVDRLDRALATRNKEGVEKALEMLKKVNPSAAHSASCLVSYLKIELLDQKDFLKNASRNEPQIGPLTGRDYTQKDKGETANSAAIGVVIAGLEFLKGIYNDINDAKKEEIAEIQRQTEGYSECKSAGKGDCGITYPKGHAEFNRRKGLPPPVPPKGSTCTGCGGGGGEVVPDDLLPHIGPNTPKAKDKKESYTRFDPNAGERLCDKVVRDFGTYMTKKVSGPRRVEEDKDFNTSLEMAPTFEVTNYQVWNDPNNRIDRLIKDRLDPLKKKPSHCGTIDPVDVTKNPVQ